MPTMFDTYEFVGAAPGPRLLVLGAVHGNETCGTHAIRRLLAELSSGDVQVRAGRLTLVPVVNRLAFERGTRGGDRNLNRNLVPTAQPRDNEDHIANELCPLLAAHDALLDLHSFHAPGEPFVMLGPPDNADALEPFAHAQDEEALARVLGVGQAVDGWLDAYARGAARRGTGVAYGIGTTEYIRSTGGWGLTLECGQHDDPRAREVAYRALRGALVHLGLAAGPVPPSRPMRTLRLCDVVDRHDGADRFAKDWCDFEPVAAGQLIGVRADGEPVCAPCDGFVVFPNAQAEPGAEWFYFAVASARLATPAG